VENGLALWKAYEEHRGKLVERLEELRKVESSAPSEASAVETLKRYVEACKVMFILSFATWVSHFFELIRFHVS